MNRPPNRALELSITHALPCPQNRLDRIRILPCLCRSHRRAGFLQPTDPRCIPFTTLRVSRIAVAPPRGERESRTEIRPQGALHWPMPPPRGHGRVAGGPPKHAGPIALSS